MEVKGDKGEVRWVEHEDVIQVGICNDLLFPCLLH